MFKHGGLAEWFKAAVLKTVDVNSVRRFESCVLRQKNLASALDQKADAFFFASAKSNLLRSRPASSQARLAGLRLHRASTPPLHRILCPP